MIFSGRPVAGFVMDTRTVVISWWQLRPSPQFSFWQELEQTISLVATITFPSEWSSCTVFSSTVKGQEVCTCLPISFSSSRTETMRGRWALPLGWSSVLSRTRQWVAQMQKVTKNKILCNNILVIEMISQVVRVILDSWTMSWVHRSSDGFNTRIAPLYIWELQTSIGNFFHGCKPPSLFFLQFCNCRKKNHLFAFANTIPISIFPLTRVVYSTSIVLKF